MHSEISLSWQRLHTFNHPALQLIGWLRNVGEPAGVRTFPIILICKDIHTHFSLLHSTLGHIKFHGENANNCDNIDKMVQSDDTFAESACLTRPGSRVAEKA